MENEESIKTRSDTENYNDIKEKVDIKVYPLRMPSLPPILVPTIPNVPLVSEYKILHKGKSLPSSRGRWDRIIHFAADRSGCGWWRLNLIEQLANYSNKAHITNTDILVDPNCDTFWTPAIKAVRMQRQVRPETVPYFVDLRAMIDGRRLPTRLIYEIDDVVIDGMMPEFNIARGAFENDSVQEAMKRNIMLCDEFTVVSKYMKTLYQEMVPEANITVIPNFATKAWFGHVFDKRCLMENYEANRRRPRVLLTAGGTHYKPSLNPYLESDYSAVLDDIISARHDFKFVWVGSHPSVIEPFIQNGDMESTSWIPTTDFPNAIKDAKCQVSIAALAYNDFNRAKSSIKFQEACYCGMPFVGQDIECYDMAFHKFRTGAEMIDIIKSLTKDEDTYMSEVDKAHEASEEWWLDDKIDDILNIYYTPYGDESRNKSEWFRKFNP